MQNIVDGGDKGADAGADAEVVDAGAGADTRTGADLVNIRDSSENDEESKEAAATQS